MVKIDSTVSDNHMYSLFEVHKILQVSIPGGSNGVTIILSAHVTTDEHSILALACDNDYIIFYCSDNVSTVSLIRHLCWFNNPEKEVKALCFDSSGMWLLIVTQDATLYILPIFSCLGIPCKPNSFWKTDNLTEIKLSGQRANMTSIQWWQTHEGEQIGIVGSDLGEISFINLISKKEVGGTYITSGILSLNILYDESHETTYLLISGSNQQQWRLLLEEKKSHYYWPFSSENDVSFKHGKGILLTDEMLLQEEKNGDLKPHRLSKFESGTFLTPQCDNGRNLVSAYNSSSCLLQVLEGDLDQMHLFSYKVPGGCKNIIMSDRFIFAVSKNQCSVGSTLQIISRKLSELSSENSKKKEDQNAEFQQFIFKDEITSIYKSSINNSNASLEKYMLNFNNSAAQRLHGIACNAGIGGCILIQKDSVWECKVKMPGEALFLSLTSTPSELPFAEKLGIALNLDLHKLYEVAADMQLSNGNFSQAVHLYQLSKCPQLKRVAHFMGYGFLSELIAYIQVLFSTRGVEVVSADKCHFANIALHCFTHQVKNKVIERNVINTTFKKFLKENIYYDEDVAAKLLSEQGLCEMIYYFSKVRGQSGLMAETLISTNGIMNTVDDITYKLLMSSGYEKVLHRSNDDLYLKCVTSFHLLQFLLAKPLFLNLHLQHLINLLPRMDVELLRRAAALYDPSNNITKLSLRNLAQANRSKRYWSTSSLIMSLKEPPDVIHEVLEMPSSEDVLKFFVFVLLMICHKQNSAMFLKDLIQEDLVDFSLLSMEKKTSTEIKPFDEKKAVFNSSSLSCGQAHVASIQSGVLYTWGKSGCGRLGIKEIGSDYNSPQHVPAFLNFQVNVVAVSCGALHTLALTDYGLFGWGSSRFGQVGVGEIQHTIQPIIIESLMTGLTEIQCGQYHSIALTEDGRVFTWGWGIHGQLGHGTAEDIVFPKMIESLKKIRIKSIGAGQGHTVLLSENGKVYTFGCGMFGQLGTGSTSKKCSPQRVPISEFITQITSGYFHILALDKANRLHTWGCNPQALKLQAQNSRRARHQNPRSSSHMLIASGSVNHKGFTWNGNFQQSHLIPSLLSIPFGIDVQQISCGSHHSILVTKNGDVYSWGRNSEGQLGNGTRKEQKIPALITGLKGKKIVKAACGADFSIVIDSNGVIYGWGQNDGGQMGQKLSDQNVKYSSTSTSGRVITIRTNRRMITITQPCHQSILRPVEINIPFLESKMPINESGSYDNECNTKKYVNTRLHCGIFQDIPDLNKVEKPSYGLKTLHTALKVLHGLCDSSTLLHYCLNFNNFQAAAKLCALESLYDEALKFQLKALATASESKQIDMQDWYFMSNYYASMLDPDNVEMTTKFLNEIVCFWMKYNISVQFVEEFLRSFFHVFSHPLCLLLFKPSAPLDQTVHAEFLSSLSPNFLLDVICAAFSGLNQGLPFVNILNKVNLLSDSFPSKLYNCDTFTNWNESIPEKQLWSDIMHNLHTGFSYHAAILLSGNEIDALSKLVLCETASNHPVTITTSKQQINQGSNHAIIFSCGHHYTLQLFQTSILPFFKKSIQTLPYLLQQTSDMMLSEYENDVVRLSCPKCVIAELKNDIEENKF